MDIKKFEGSRTLDEFINGLLLAGKSNTLGEVWEKCINCTNCLFAESCQLLCSALEEQDPTKNPTCRDVVNILLGEIKAEDLK